LAKLDHKSANHAVRDSGTAHHQSRAAAESMAGGAIALGQALMVLAFLALNSAEPDSSMMQRAR
jgi:hypothetical protein